jgi:RNA polymerase sigma factor (sigma-70 family)
VNNAEQQKDASSVVNAVAMEKRKGSSVIETAFRDERNRLLDFIRRRVRTEEDAEDILSDVFYQLMSSYSVTEPIEKMTSWLFTVARNRIIDWYRKKRPESLPSYLDDESLPLNLEDILFDPTQDPDSVYARSLLWTELAGALDEMPKEQKEVFVMHELEGKSFKEIAAITGEPLNTLLSRKRYAVLFLREALQELYSEFTIQR